MTAIHDKHANCHCSIHDTDTCWPMQGTLVHRWCCFCGTICTTLQSHIFTLSRRCHVTDIVIGNVLFKFFWHCQSKKLCKFEMDTLLTNDNSSNKWLLNAFWCRGQEKKARTISNIFLPPYGAAGWCSCSVALQNTKYWQNNINIFWLFLHFSWNC